MTAHKMAVAFSMAVLAMGAIDRAAAFDDQSADLDRPVGTAATTIDVDQRFDAIVGDRFNTRTAGSKSRVRGVQPRPAFTPYAGIGINKYKLSMNFGNGNVALKKDKGFKRPRLILGMGYGVTEDLSLGFEYRALASDVGGETLNLDTRFTTHNVFLKARYKF